MSEAISNVLNWCRNNKRIFVFSFVCFLVFGFLIFPYDDLTGFVSDQVYNGSGKKVTLMASGLNLSILPPGVKFSGDEESPLTIDSLDFPPSMPPLELESLAISPSISSLLQFKNGFSANMNGLFGGEAKVDFTEGDKVSDTSEVRQIVLSIDAEEVALKDMGQFLSLPMNLGGNAEMDVDAVIDPEFRGQPESEFELEVDNLRLVGFTHLGMAIPTLDFKKARIKGVLKGGDLQLEEVLLGEKGDDIFGTINGQVKFSLLKSGARLIPQFGSYRFNVDLTTASKFDSTLGLLDLVLSDIKQYKSRAPGGTRFNMALTGSSFHVPPRLSRPRR